LIIIDDLKRLAEKQDKLAQELVGQWGFPMDLMFVSPEGKLLNRLNAFRDFRHAHPDVGQPSYVTWGGPTHEEVFLTHLDLHFPLGRATATPD